MRVPLVLLVALAAQGAAAQTTTSDAAPRTRFVDIIKGDACPRSTDPNEIVVCRALDPESQFRLPPTIRNEQRQARDNVREERAALTSTNIGGLGACSTAGIGGQSGCTGGLDVLAAGRKALDAVRGEDTVPDKVPQ